MVSGVRRWFFLIFFEREKGTGEWIYCRVEGLPAGCVLVDVFVHSCGFVGKVR